MIHQHDVSHSLWGSILKHWASHWCSWVSCIVSCIPFIVNWTWDLRLQVKNMGAWYASEAPVAAIGLSLWTTQGVLRWVYRASRSQILPYGNNRGSLLCCQRWTLQSRTGVFNSVSSHPKLAHKLATFNVFRYNQLSLRLHFLETVSLSPSTAGNDHLSLHHSMGQWHLLSHLVYWS